MTQQPYAQNDIPRSLATTTHYATYKKLLKKDPPAKMKKCKNYRHEISKSLDECKTSGRGFENFCWVEYEAAVAYGEIEIDVVDEDGEENDWQGERNAPCWDVDS